MAGLLRPQDPYRGTPDVNPQTGMPGDTFNVKSNPENFGGQVGQATTGLGKTMESTGNEMVDLAIKQQGLLNETWATNAMTQNDIDGGKVYGDYKTLKGLDAVNGRDAAIANLQKIRDGISNSAPNPAAKRAFDLMANRRFAYMVQDMYGYAATSAKQAATASRIASMNNSINEAGGPNVAFDTNLFGSALGNIRFQAAGAFADDEGYSSVITGMDPKTGDPIFAAGSQGDQAKAAWQNYIDEAIGKAWYNRIQTIASDPLRHNISMAVQVLEDGYKQGKIPPKLYNQLSRELATPFRMFDSKTQVDNFMGGVMSDYNAAMSGTGGAPSGGTSSPAAGSIPAGSRPTQGSFTEPDSERFIKSIIPNAFWAPGSGERTAGEESALTHGTITHSPHVATATEPAHAHDFVPRDASGSVEYWTQADLNKFRSQASAAGWDTKDLRIEYNNGVNSTGYHIHWAWNPQPTTGRISGNGPARTDFKSPADYFDHNYSTILADAERQADSIEDPVQRDMFLSGVKRKLDLQMSMGRQSARADQDDVLSYMQGNNPTGKPITDPSVMDDDPKIRDTWFRVKASNPYAERAVDSIARSNSRGVPNTWGTDFWKSFNQVVSGQETDPANLHNGVDQSVRPEHQPLTTTGAGQLSDIIKKLGDPKEKAFWEGVQRWLGSPQIHGAVTMTDRAPNWHDNKGDETWNKWLMTVIPRLEAGHRQGIPLSNMIDPNNKADYVGGDLPFISAKDFKAHYMQSIQIGAPGQGAANTPTKFNPASITNKDQLMDAVRKGEIKDEATYNAIVARLRGPQVPTPH